MRSWRNMLPPPLAIPGTVLVTVAILACRLHSSETPAPGPRGAVLGLARDHGLVEVSSVDARIRTHLRYTTVHNGSRHILYPPDMPCLLRESTARKLSRAQTYLEEHGLGILIWDAYRPPEVQQSLWDLSGRIENYVSDPTQGWSAHCTGTAIDLTLVDKAGRTLPMPTDFDVFRKEASAIYTGGDPEVRRRLRLLQKAMRRAGFSSYIREWWHFSDPDFQPLGPELIVFASRLGIRITPPRTTATGIPQR